MRRTLAGFPDHRSVQLSLETVATLHPKCAFVQLMLSTSLHAAPQDVCCSASAHILHFVYSKMNKRVTGQARTLVVCWTFCHRQQQAGLGPHRLMFVGICCCRNGLLVTLQESCCSMLSVGRAMTPQHPSGRCTSCTTYMISSLMVSTGASFHASFPQPWRCSLWLPLAPHWMLQPYSRIHRSPWTTTRS